MTKKIYQIKVYSLDWTYQKTISPSIIMSDISFSKNINGWTTDINIELDLKFGNSDFSNGQVVKISVFDDNNKSWKLIYTGVINGVVRNANTNSETITLVCLWISSLLSQIIYDNAWRVFTKIDDPANIIKNIIDYINTIYTWWRFTYGWWKIDTYGSTIEIDFNYTDCFSAIKKVKDVTDFYFYIDQSWEIYFKAKPTTATHSLTNKKNVENIDMKEDIESLVNRVFVERKGGTIKTYQDTASQTTYWIKEKKISKTELWSVTSQDTFWDNYIAENKDPKKKTKVIVNNLYDIDSIEPWSTIKIKNIEHTIDNIQVLNVQYTPDKVTLSLDEYISFWQQVNFNK